VCLTDTQTVISLAHPDVVQSHEFCGNTGEAGPLTHNTGLCGGHAGRGNVGSSDVVGLAQHLSLQPHRGGGGEVLGGQGWAGRMLNCSLAHLIASHRLLLGVGGVAEEGMSLGCYLWTFSLWVVLIVSPAASSSHGWAPLGRRGRPATRRVRSELKVRSKLKG
jgi:hypothetical protein